MPDADQRTLSGRIPVGAKSTFGGFCPRVMRATCLPVDKFTKMYLPSGETTTPLGAEKALVPGMSVQPVPGCHSLIQPIGSPLSSLFFVPAGSAGSAMDVTTSPPSGSKATESGQEPCGAITHPIQVNRGRPCERSTSKTSTASRPP